MDFYEECDLLSTGIASYVCMPDAECLVLNNHTTNAQKISTLTTLCINRNMHS